MREPFQYYQSSNNLPQSAQTLGFSLLTNCLAFNLKSCFVFLKLRFNTSSRFAQPRVAMFVVDLSRLSQSFLLCVVQHFELLCSFLTCFCPSVLIFLALFCSTLQQHFESLALTFFVPTESPSAHVSFTRAFSISTLPLTIRFLSCGFLYFCYCWPQVFPSTQPSHAVDKTATCK